MPSLPLRLTVAPDEDIELASGQRFADVQGPLAAVLGRHDLARRTLFAGNKPLDDDALSGQPPLLSGAVLTTSAQPPHILDLAEQAETAPWQLRVTNGPDAGWAFALRPGARVAVTGQNSAAAEHCDVVLADPQLHRQEFVVRATKRGPRVRLRRRPGVLFNRPRTGRGRGQRRPGWRWRRWRAQVPLYAGGSVFDVMQTSDPTPPATGHTTMGTKTTSDISAKPRSRGALMFLLPAVGSIVMAVTMRQPLFALMALAGPLMLVMSMLSRRKSRVGTKAANKGLHSSARTGTRQDAEPYTGPVSVISTAHQLTNRAIPPGLPRAAALLDDSGHAQARALVCWFAAAGFRVVFLGSARALAPWQAARWLTGAQAFRPEAIDGAFRTPSDGDPDARTVVVAVHPRTDGWLPALSAAWSPAAARMQLLLLDSATARLPAWVTPAAPGGGISKDSFDVLCRSRAAAASHHIEAFEEADGTDPTPASQQALPATVALVTQLDAPESIGTSEGTQPTALWVRDRWARSPSGLQAILGAGPSGQPVTVNLPVDGPHALVAGTTGAGKSEFLQTLICSLALTYPPDELVFALIDYKGGTSFGECAHLPHVVGLVTDLEPGLARRALTGLQAELHRRERLMARAGVANLDAYREAAGPSEPTVPRLMIVVDEFRALADDLPDFLPGLLRIAAQGRSLGIHLVLATQRPGGAVNADMRANIGLRVCLRVTDPTDSRDVIDSPAAAHLPASAPGRTVMITTTQPQQTFQSAYAPAPHPDKSVLVRRAPDWFTAGPAEGPGDWQAGPGASVAPDNLTRLVAGARSAAKTAGFEPPQYVWLPALPDEQPLPTTQDMQSQLNPAVLPLLLLDVPAEQRRCWDGWDPHRSHLAIEGSAGSGRTTTLSTLAHTALERGYHVHLIARADAFSNLLSHPGVGTIVDQDDPRRIAALLRELTRAAPSTPMTTALAQIVLIDDLEEVLTALSSLARGAGPDVLTAALRMPRSRGVSCALATARPVPSALKTLISSRVVLASTAKQDDVARGVPSALGGLGTTPGRAVWFGAAEPLIGQIANPDLTRSDPCPDTAESSGPDPLRIRALPQHVTQMQLLGAAAGGRQGEAQARSTAHQLPVGLGGNNAAPLSLDLSQGALIAGPHGSGRSSVLALLHQQLDPDRCLVIARDGPLLDLPAGLRVSEYNGTRLVEALNNLRDLNSAQPWTILLDDADALFQTCPMEAEHLTRDRRPARLVATATTSGAAGAMRGPLTELRSTRTGIILDPGTAGSADIFGAPLTWLIEPGLCPAGRGVLVHGRDLQLVQIASVQR